MQSNVLISQDLSCAGQVSLGCALPLLGALNLAPTVLPTALLSTHTGGFGENTYLDLSKEMISILQHWKTLSLKFSAIYLGYLGEKPLDVLQENLADVSTAETMLLIDPVMGDHGKLYRGFDQEYVEKMRCLISKADIATPNYTEAKLLLGEPLTTSPVATDDAFETARRVQGRFNLRNIVLTGIDSGNGLISIVGCEQDGGTWMVSRSKHPGNYFGTGDLFASVLFSSLLYEKDLRSAGTIAMDFVSEAIVKTQKPHDPRFGADYGAAIPQLLKKLEIV